MRYSTGLLLAGAAFSYAGTQQCSGTATDEGGNWFCGLVNHIMYEGIGGSGQFPAVTAMNSNGQCSKSNQPFSGPLAPLDEGLSMHFRGPLNLKKAAVYNLKSDKKRRDALNPSPHVHARRQGHSHFHNHNQHARPAEHHVHARGQEHSHFHHHNQHARPAEHHVHARGQEHSYFHHHNQHVRPASQKDETHQQEKREDWVTVNMNGKIVSWVNNWFGPSSTAAPAAATAPTDGSVVVEQGDVVGLPAPTATQSAPPSSSSVSSVSGSGSKPGSGSKSGSGSKDSSSNGDTGSGSGSSSSGSSGSVGGPWDRVAYYNAEQGVADNMVFMGNYGGQGSGVWDPTWSNSLAYLNSQGTGGSSSPQTLKDVTLKSNQEFAIFSAEKCDSSCGYSRVSDIAYKGFSGANKVFVWTFSMPHESGGASAVNNDMPALWLLNARIPRTMQYGQCSCWPACGEADIYEVLAPGDNKCKSTIHLTNGGGSSDYFNRPTSGTVTVATVFDEKTASVSIKHIGDDFNYAEGIDTNTVNDWLNAPNDKLSSLFQIAS